VSAIALLVIVVQSALLAAFCFMAFFNYLYGIASLFRPRIRRVPHSQARVAVVIVSFNERHVLEETLRACDALTHENTLIVLADDSSDKAVVESLRSLARSRGCLRAIVGPATRCAASGHEVEVWESPDFVLLHRQVNTGFKAGAVETVRSYLRRHGVEYMYLLDADWRPQPDVLERTLEVIEADDAIAFVQTRRVSPSLGMNRFQKYVAIIEEGCYYVDFQGRQVLGHPILFSGCCALLRLSSVAAVGGFVPGHLTEDLDLTNRFWLMGYRGVYLDCVVNHGEVPFTYDHFRRQQERWSAGTARTLRSYGWAIVRSSRLSMMAKLSALRQDAYFSSSLLTGMAIATAMAVITWLTARWNTYAVESYLLALGTAKVPLLTILYACILSNWLEPLVMILVKKRSAREIVYLPMAVWYAWSVLATYIVGNLKGFAGISMSWFRTPKYQRDRESRRFMRSPLAVRLVNAMAGLALLVFYFSQGWLFGWFDEFALLLLPAFFLAATR
jgi:cellulose synthase/poly-beta-1,6-N-acetylglucosamine synthase-like glycosyltransferase